MKHLNTIYKISILMTMFFVSISCTKNEVPGKLTIDDENISLILTKDAQSCEVTIDSNIEWRLFYDPTLGWISTDIVGGPSTTKTFTLKVLANDEPSPRSTSIKVYTVDRKDEMEISVYQNGTK